MNIKAIFPEGVHKLTVHGLTQWDRGRSLTIQAPDLPNPCEVHVAHVGQSEAIVCGCQAADGSMVVSIPDECLQQSLPIMAWVYASSAQLGATTHTVILPIEARPKPSTTPESVDIVLTDVTIKDNGIHNAPAGVAYNKVIAAVEEVPSEAATVTPTKETQEVTAVNTRYLSKVTVEPIPAEYIKPESIYHIDTNGDYDVREYAEVRVTVSDAPASQVKRVSIDANGEFRIRPDEGVTFMTEVVATVAVVPDYYDGSYEVL